MASSEYEVRRVRHVSDEVTDGMESLPVDPGDEQFKTEYFGVYANEEDGTQRWIADFADEYRAREYAGLFNGPALTRKYRCSYVCRDCFHRFEKILDEEP